jgi:hypothetical protein
MADLAHHSENCHGGQNKTLEIARKTCFIKGSKISK